MADKIEAFRLRTDDEIEEFFNNDKYSIYFREGDSGDYEKSDQPLDVVLDATVFGFEIIASEEDRDVLKEDEISLSDVEETLEK